MNTRRTIAYILAIILAVILLCIIFRQIKEYHLQDDPMLVMLKEIIRPIEYDGKSIADDLRLYRGDKSYTINKSQTFMCLYDKKNGQEYYPLNMLTHVLLHERAHSLNKTDVGHTAKFFEIFDDLLKKAEALGIYNPNIPIIQDYCP